jgi:hypothetical protein
MEHESKSKLRINWRLLNVLAKLFTVAIILWMCVNLLSGLIQTPFGTSSEETSVDDDGTTSAFAEATAVNPREFLMDLTSGGWSFGESDWKFSMRPESTGARIDDAPLIVRRANALFDDQATIQMFQELDVKPQTFGDDGLQIWQVEVNDISIALFTRDSVVQMIRCRLPSQNGFSIMEGIPKMETMSEESLLPLCDGVSQLGLRRNKLGEISSAVLEIEAQNKIDIRVFWKENGWEVRPLPNLALSAGDSGQQTSRYRCSKEDVVVEASYFIDEHSGKGSIILVRIE